MIAELEMLRVPAPQAMRERVLVGAGIADGFLIADSPLGPVAVAFNDRGVSAVSSEFDAAALADAFARRFGRSVYRATPSKSLGIAIHRALESGRGNEVPFDLRGVPQFFRAVLEAALHIPVGEVRSYQWAAACAGRPAAVRAAGTALARNPIPILIPCHRVVRSDGILGQYGMGGPDAKRAILMHEGVDLAGRPRATGRLTKFRLITGPVPSAAREGP